MNYRSSVRFIALILTVLPLAAQRPDTLSPKVDRVRDYDIRAEVPTSGAPSSDGRSLVSRREPAIRAFLRRQGGGSADWRVVLNEAGLPKSLSGPRGSLTDPTSGSADLISRNFLRANRELFQFTDTEISTLHLIRTEERDGLTFLRFKQSLDGIDVFEGQVRVAVDRQGRVVDAGVGAVVPGLLLATTPSLTPDDALRAAYKILDLPAPADLHAQDGAFDRQARFDNPNGSHLSPLTAELTIFPRSADSAILAYRLLVEIDDQAWYEIVVDADNASLLYLQNLYRNAAARVWKQSPLSSSREMVDLPDSWLSGQATAGVTTGNNVDAYLDADGNAQPDSTTDPNMKSGRAYNADLIFDFPAGERNTLQSPKGFQPAAVTNLFYAVNLAHDYYYSLGFDEAAGNFQKSNFGKDGKANDAVNAQAQDGLSNDNASFASPPDGTSPRMRMGLFTYGLSASSASSYTDADYDAQVIFHEYGHGVTNRIVGAGSDTSCLAGTQSGALGEGWSDYFAVSYFNTPVLGQYVGNNPFRGSRRHSYERYPYTYEDLGNLGFEVHNDGEIWAAALWDLRKQLGPEITDKLVVAALHLTPCRPSMPDARDAIVAADKSLTDGANRSAIWRVFAAHGLGQSARGIDGFIRQGTVFTAAYDQPADLVTGNRVPLVTSHALPRVGMGQDFVYKIDAADSDGGTLAYQLVAGPPGATVNAATGEVKWSAGFLSQPFQVAVTDGQGGRVVHSFYVYVETSLSDGSPVTISGGERTAGYATIVVPAGAAYLQITLRGGTGDADLFLAQPNGAFVGVSARNGNSETLTIPAPAPGIWGIEVDAYRLYDGLTLLAALPAPPTLDFPDFTLTDLSGDATSETIYKVTVPAGQTVLRVTTSGGTGDVDLYVRKGTVGCSTSALLTPCRFDSSSALTGSAESVTINNPAAADYFIDVRGFSAYSGVTLHVSGAPEP